MERAVNNKFCVDSVIFPTEKDKISYAFHQLDQPIFQQLDAWIGANSSNLSIDRFYQQIEHCMGIYMLTKRAKEKLHTVTMKPSNKTVDKYYQQIFKLWEQAKTPERERVKRFEITLKLFIAHALIGQKYTKIMDVLDAAREIEHRKSQISSKFARDLARTFQKASRSAGSFSGRTWGKSGSLSQTGGSSSTGANSVAPAATSSFSGAPKGSGKSVNTSTSVNPNAKFIPTATEPAGWVETWYNPENYPQTLQDDERATFLQQERCWECKGSGHRGSYACCPLTNQKLNTTARAVEEVSDSETKKT